MRIGELAQRTGVSTKTIRFYEDIGVLPEAQRASNGYRVYGERTADRLSFVREAQATGLSLDEISAVLRSRDRGEATCDHVMHLLTEHLREVDERIAALHAARKKLASMVERATALDPAACDDPNRCQTIAPGPH